MKSTRPVLAAVLLALALPAQDDAKQLPVEFQKLAAEWQAASAAYTEARAAVRGTEAYKAARAAKDFAKMRELRGPLTPPDGKAFGVRALALADRYSGDECLSVLTFAATNFDDADTVKFAIERVLRDHLESEGIVELLDKSRSFQRLLGRKETHDLLSKVLADNPHPLPRAHALVLMSQATMRGRELTLTGVDDARALLIQAGELAKGTPLAERIRRMRSKDQPRLPGSEVDISGEDMDGVAFKLSDYRGKVVLLDFWGFW